MSTITTEDGTQIYGATLKVYKGAPHGMCTTLEDQVNADLLAFIEGDRLRA